MNASAPSPSKTLWRNADFVRLLAAGGVSAFGARITREGLPLIAVLLLRATPAEIGLLAALRAAPAILVGPLCGGWVDTTRRRRVLIAADLSRAALLLAIPLAAFAQRLDISAVYAVGAAVGALSSLFDMADHAYLPTVTGRDTLVQANSALGAVESVAEIGGPGLAGILFSILSAPVAILANCLTYLASALILVGIRTKEHPVPPGDEATEGWISIFDGVRLSWRVRPIRALLLTVAASTLFGSFFSALYIPFAIRTLGLTPAMLGATIAIGGIGALAGAAMASGLSTRLGIGWALIVTGFLYAGFTALIPMAGGSPGVGMAVLMAAQFLGDAAGTAFFIYVASLRQATRPAEVLGRVAGAFAAVGGVASIAGALGGGALSQVLGLRETMIIACAGMAMAQVFAIASPLRRQKVLLDPAPPADA